MKLLLNHLGTMREIKHVCHDLLSVGIVTVSSNEQLATRLPQSNRNKIRIISGPLNINVKCPSLWYYDNSAYRCSMRGRR